jgi:hypothetical protein
LGVKALPPLTPAHCSLQEAALDLMSLVARLRPEDAPAADAALQHSLWLLGAACDGLLPPECARVPWRRALAGALRHALAALADAGTAGCVAEGALAVLCRAVHWSGGGGDGAGGSSSKGDAEAQAEWLELVLAVVAAAPGVGVRLAPALPLLPAGEAAAGPLARCWRVVLAETCTPECAGAAQPAPRAPWLT